jgi:alkaline phosphatase
VNASYSREPVTRFLGPLSKAALTGEGIEVMLNEERTNIIEVMAMYFGVEDLTGEEIEAISEAPPGQMNKTVGPIISVRAGIGGTTTGHTGEDLVLFTHLPGGSHITGVIENTEIARICAGAWDIDLNEITRLLYNDAVSAFAARGATIAIDDSIISGSTMTVTLGSSVLEIFENKNYVIFNGEKIVFDSIVVYQSGIFYVPVSVLEMI